MRAYTKFNYGCLLLHKWEVAGRHDGLIYRICKKCGMRKVNDNGDIHRSLGGVDWIGWLGIVTLYDESKRRHKVITTNFSHVVCYVCKVKVRHVKDAQGNCIAKSDQVWVDDAELVKELEKHQEPVSHGMCQECFKVEIKKVDDYMKARG